MPLDMKQKMKIALIIMCIIGLGALAYSWIVNQEGEACGEDWGYLGVNVEDSYGNTLRNVNVTVWVGQDIVKTGLTDNNGEVGFGYLPYRCYNLTLDKRGCQNFCYYFCITSHWKTLNLVLPYQNFSLTLNITNIETGLPIENATVQVYRYDYAEEYKEWFNISGSTGFTAFPELEYDEYAVVVTHPDYFTYSALIFLAEDTCHPVSLQAIPGPDPDPDPDGFPSWMDLAIGISIGFIVVAGVAFLLLQRKVRYGDEERSKWK
jgi:hypothetical protein